MPKVSIVIPLYTSDLTEEEWISLDRCFSLLSPKYDIAFVVPVNFNFTPLNSRYDKFIKKEFDPKYFQGLKGYNQLMLSEDFYRAFIDYEYILIYQSDCFLFNDKLEYWCNLQYDYIGAPWLPKKKYTTWTYRLYFGIKKLYNTVTGASDYTELFYKVGNGGLSLRKTHKFLNVSIKEKERIQVFVALCHHNKFNEDVFWSIEANKLGSDLKIPNWKEALRFSFDKLPEEALILNENKLPFGCHGWTKQQMHPFWEPIIKNLLKGD